MAPKVGREPLLAGCGVHRLNQGPDHGQPFDNSGFFHVAPAKEPDHAPDMFLVLEPSPRIPYLARALSPDDAKAQMGTRLILFVLINEAVNLGTDQGANIVSHAAFPTD